ncbi:MAG: hypothetical protein ACRC67_07160 [Inquilinus sp.]|uniref:hypothetical protein n=1 Tax=Inquilinus sp. TaxID=1932117 RepID=UPI003F30F26A
MRVVSCVLALICAVTLPSCSIQRAQVAADAKKQMIGLPRAQVLACMGVPQAQAQDGATEVWSYASGGDVDVSTINNAYTYGNNATVFGTSSARTRSCMVSVVMTSGKVSAVNYAGRTGGILTEGEQCAFAVRNCVP